jgi:hypothetical protein
LATFVIYHSLSFPIDNFSLHANFHIVMARHGEAEGGEDAMKARIPPSLSFSALQSVRAAHFHEEVANGILNAKTQGHKGAMRYLRLGVFAVLIPKTARFWQNFPNRPPK